MTAGLGGFWPPLVIRRHDSSWLQEKSTRMKSHQTGKDFNILHTIKPMLCFGTILSFYIYFIFIDFPLVVSCRHPSPPTGNQTPIRIFLLFIFNWESIPLPSHDFTIILVFFPLAFQQPLSNHTSHHIINLSISGEPFPVQSEHSSVFSTWKKNPWLCITHKFTSLIAPFLGSLLLLF